jgi:hypothetical protein
MQQKKSFTGGMDSDSAFEYIEQGRDRYRLNVRVLSSDTGQIGSVETVNGNTLVSFTLPLGLNTVIASTEYQLTKNNYYLVRNSLKNHSILEFNQVTNAVSIVFQDPILNFQITNLITGINVIARDKDNHLLYWSDGWINPLDPNDYNEPKKINIEKGKAFMRGDYINGYKFPFDPEILFRIKQPPLCPIDYTWSGLDQQNQFIFKAGNSGTGEVIPVGNVPIKIVFDHDLFDPGAEYNAFNSTWTVGATGSYSINAQVKLDGGAALDSLNSAIYIAGNNNAYISIIVNGVIRASQYNAISTPAAPKPPGLIAASLLLNSGDIVYVAVRYRGDVNGLLATGIYYNAILNIQDERNVNHLFKRLFLFQVEFIYDDYEKSAWSPMSNYVFPKTIGSDGVQSDDFILQDNKITIQVPTGNSIVTKINIYAKEIGNFAPPALSSLDFSLIATLNKAELNIQDNILYPYEFTNEVNAVPADIKIASKLFDNVPLASVSQELIKGTRLTDGLITENFNPVAIDMRLLLSYVLVDSNPNGHYPARQYLKSGGLYEYGIVYYDHANRSGLTNVTKGLSTVLLQNGKYGTSLYVPFLTEQDYNAPHGTPNLDLSYVPEVNVEIYNKPPSWATHYQIIRSKNKVMGRYIQFTAKQVSYVDSQGNPITASVATKVIVNVGNIIGLYKTENPNSTLVYDFVKGDRIRFIANPTGGASTGSVAPFFVFNDTEITDWDPATQNISFFINSNNTLRQMDSGVLYEIYNPTPPIINEGELVFEINECFDIITLPDGEKAHQGEADNQGYYNFTSYSVIGGFIAFSGIGISGFSVGDKIKVIGLSTGFTYPSSNYATITSLTMLAGNETIITDILFSASTIYPTPGVITKAATITLSGGDCFRRYQNMVWQADTHRLVAYVESMAASNMFTSNAYDYGRPNAIDENIIRITRPSTIRYSELFIAETFINGLSSVFDNNFVTYEQKYGGIYKLYNEQQRLLLFQELKIGAVTVEQNVITTADGSTIVTQSENILNPTVIYYNGELGIGQHPESFSKYNQAKYGIDVKRGIVWRLSTDGLTPISEYFQHIYFTDLCKKILLCPTKVNIYGVYDIRFGEYIIAVSGFTYDSIDIPAQTIAFNEKNNAWSTHYSYNPENMVGNGINIITFKSGQLWKHNENTVQNNFYGIQYNSQVECVLNELPSNVKVLQAISEETDGTVWAVPTISTPNGQLSNLIESDFQLKENTPSASVLFDENTPNVLNPLIEGDPMRSRTFLATLQLNLTTYSKMFAVNFEFVISNLHNIVRKKGE